MSFVIDRPVSRMAIAGALLPAAAVLAVAALPGATPAPLPLLAVMLVAAALGAALGARLGGAMARAQQQLQALAAAAARDEYEAATDALPAAAGDALRDMLAALRRRHEQQRESDREHAAQMQAIDRSQAVIEFTPDGHIVHANDNFLRVLGYRLDEIKGQHHAMFVAPAYRDSGEYRAFWEKLGRGEYDAGRYMRVAKGGREVWIQASYNPVLDAQGKPQKIVKYASDVTGEVHAAARLQRAIDETQAVVSAARGGDLSQRLSTQGQEGSVLALCEAINALLDDIAATRAREREVAVATARIKQGLDVAETNVMVADDELNIVYVNQSIRAMLAAAEADIRKDVPAFNAANVVGANIDIFHKNPAFQRGLLARMTQAHKARIAVGGRTFSLIVNPIDSDGRRVGYVVEWKDLTVELAAQAYEQERQAAEKRLADENLRIKNALDNVTTNVMIADNERQIMYVNKSIMQMLSRAEADLRRDLPNFDVRKLLGGSIDQFHKAPEHQRRMLENLRDTYRANIKVGGRSFALTVNPIINGAGERLGTVVEWLDRSAEIAVEAEIGAIVKAAADGDFSQRVAVEGKEGFFRQLAESINQLLTSSGDGLAEVARMFGALAQGDLTQRIDAEFRGTFAKLKNDANMTVERLTGIVQQIQQASDTINTAAREIAAGNSDLSSRTEQQAASLEETAS
uniref:PAS domain S-box protein n=1 Tax=Solimonas soli TaxID=413479 RepID=UPI001FE1913C